MIESTKLFQGEDSSQDSESGGRGRCVNRAHVEALLLSGSKSYSMIESSFLCILHVCNLILEAIIKGLRGVPPRSRQQSYMAQT